MILTGNEITKEVNKKNIVIIPFHLEQINPNSYNYRINDELIEFTVKNQQKFEKRIRIPKSGIILEPHKTYLASTLETLGSNKYAMSLIGRSSLGRLGLFLQVSANLGHTGSIHKWTLELVATKKIRIYPFMIIGQISFWNNKGDINLYRNSYSDFNSPQISKLEHAK
ncbi:MAG: dCTP deaminase [Nanobdellota archaeon]